MSGANHGQQDQGLDSGKKQLEASRGSVGKKWAETVLEDEQGNGNLEMKRTRQPPQSTRHGGRTAACGKHPRDLLLVKPALCCHRPVLLSGVPFSQVGTASQPSRDA